MRSEALLTVLMLVLVTCVPPGIAQTQVTWDGDTDTNWANGDNWDGGSVPIGHNTLTSGNVAVFPSAFTTYQPVLNADQQVNGLTFQKPDGGWTIGNDGTLHTLWLRAGVAPVTDVATSGTTSIDATVKGWGTTFALSGATMDISGALELSLGAKGFGVNGGTLRVGSIDLSDSETGERYGIGGDGVLEIAGAAGANVTGNVLVQGSSVTIVMGHKDALGTGKITSNNDSIFQASTDLTGANAITTEFELKDSTHFFSGSHSIELTNVTRFGGGGKSLTNDIVAGKTLEITNDVSAFYGNGTILSGVYGSGETVLSADLSGPGTFTRNGGGILTLSGNNSHGAATPNTQQTRLLDGVLKLASATAAGLAQIKTAANPDGSTGGVIGLAHSDFTLPLTNLEKSDGTVKMFEGGGFAAYGADRNVNFFGDARGIGWNQGGFVRPTSAGGVFILGHETADATVTLVNPLNISNGGTQTHRILVKDGSAAIDGCLQGAFTGQAEHTFEKAGDGTLELAGTNSYLGPTLISAGTLLITGDSSAATGNITVDPGATLGGTGIVGGTTTVNGALAPGASAGVLRFENEVTLDALAALDIDLGGTTAGVDYDVLDVGGILDLGGAVLNVDLIDPFTPSAGDVFDILDWGTLAGSFGTVDLPALDLGLEWDDSQLLLTGELSVAATIVPEPAALISLSLAALSMLGIRRRR